MENFESEVTDIIKGYITAFLQVQLTTFYRKFCKLISPEGVWLGRVGKVEEQGYSHLSSHFYRFARINTPGEPIDKT